MPPHTDADEWRDLRFHFIRAGRSAGWPPGHRLTRPWFKGILLDFTIWFFFQGRGTLIDHGAGCTYPLKPGICLCMKPGMDLEVCQSEADLLGDTWIHVNILRRSRVLKPERWPECALYTEVPDIGFFDQAMRHVVALVNNTRLNRQMPGHTRLASAEYLLKTLLLDLKHSQSQTRLEERDQHHERIISSTLSTLHEDPRRFHTVDDLARASGYSPSHFRSLCLKLTGKKPSDLLINARIERARDYLCQSKLSIGMIAEAIGYENIYYFSRQFRMLTGMTASAYRKAYSEVKG